MSRARVITTLLALSAVVGTSGAAAPAASAGETWPCAKRKGEISRSSGGVVWHRGGSLFGCVAGYRNPDQFGDVEGQDPWPHYAPTKARRLGPWSKGSRIVFDGVEATWAYRTRSKTGEPIDRMYAVDVRVGKPWLRGARPTFDLADRVVADLKLGINFAAWVTTRGTVLAGAEGGFGGGEAAPDAFDLDLVGAGTPASAGLVPALRPQGARLLIGQFPEAAAAAQSTLQLKRLSDLDMQNEQCIGSYRYEVTVRPKPDQPRVGGIWRAAYFPSGVECRG